MAKHLIVCGHGAGDPGAVANGANERDWTRNTLRPAIQKYSKQLKSNSIDFYDISKDMYAETQKGFGAYSVSGYESVTEFHLDSASATATGGHVIISSKYNPDSFDLAIAKVIQKYVGWWGGVSGSQGINKRNNLLNLNVFANRGISYRLAELGFISNAGNLSNLNKNIDAVAKGLVEAITGEKLAGEVTPVPVVPANPVKANLDVVNVNAQTFQIVGWMLNLDVDLRNRTPWLFFIDSKTNLEIGRFKGVRITRQDVKGAFPNPSGEYVGFQFDGLTPEALTKGNGNFKIMFRYSGDVGNVSYTENWFDNVYAEAPDINKGHLDLTQPIDGKLRLAGWHLASNQQQHNKHFLFLMDAETKKEITRWDVTTQSYMSSPDVKSIYNNNMLVQAAKCRFDQTVEIPEKSKGKRTYIMSRYASDVLGNARVADVDLNDFLIFL